MSSNDVVSALAVGGRLVPLLLLFLCIIIPATISPLRSTSSPIITIIIIFFRHNNNNNNDSTVWVAQTCPTVTPGRKRPVRTCVLSAYPSVLVLFFSPWIISAFGIDTSRARRNSRAENCCAGICTRLYTDCSLVGVGRSGAGGLALVVGLAAA